MKRLFLILLFLLISCDVFGMSITLEWDANTEQDLAGYKIYYGNYSRTYLQPYGEGVDVGNVVTHTIDDLDDMQTYYFAATAYDNEIPSLESDYSNEVVWEYRRSEIVHNVNGPVGKYKINGLSIVTP